MPHLPFDLKQYGMNWFFDPVNNVVVPMDYRSRLNKYTKISLDAGEFVLVSNEEKKSYKSAGAMGKGSFGTVFLVNCSDGREMVIKLLEPGVSMSGIIKEAIIQIIVHNLTVDIKHDDIGLYGPYAPAIYEIGYIESSKQMFIASERMRATTNAMLKVREKNPEMLRIDCPNMLIQVATILEDLFVLCEFNHRDLKSDNCMYIRDEHGNIQIRLIDFGMSCLSYGNYQITGSTFEFLYCSLKTRDMTQFIYELHKFHKYMPEDLRGVFEALLTFKRGTELCKMYEDCEGQKAWKNTYTYLNSEDPNPNCTPTVVRNVMMAYKNGQNWRVHLDFVPSKSKKKTENVSVPKGKLLNPHSGRLVSAKGKIGQELLAESKGNKALSEAIGLKGCPPDKPEFNPFTRRCVSACEKGFRRSITFKCIKK